MMRDLSIVAALCTMVWFGSCTHTPSGFHTPESRYGTGSPAKIIFIDGEVYLRRLDPDPQPLGPFERESNGDYSFEDPPGYFHSLNPGLEGEWLYAWSYLHMSGDPVDASELAIANGAQNE